jgi:hypothetical protein
MPANPDSFSEQSCKTVLIQGPINPLCGAELPAGPLVEMMTFVPPNLVLLAL